MAVKKVRFQDHKLIWIDLQNPSKEEYEKVANDYNLDLYTLYDSLEPNHLPKFEEQVDMNFFIVRMRVKGIEKTVAIQQISSKIAFFYNETFLITIHRNQIPFLDDMFIKQVESGGFKSINQLVIRLLKNVLITYEMPVANLSDEINKYESNLFLKGLPPHLLQNLFYLKNKASLSRKILLLTDGVLDSIKVNRHEKASLQDVKDLHTKLIVLYEQVLEEISNLQNIYISISSQKTNEVMKTLTVFSMFFLPLTFLAGVYGMNFKYMPELDYKWAYPACLLLMVIISLVIYIWFKRKKWM